MSTSARHPSAIMKTYVYKPLPRDTQTRILEIYPSRERDAPLRGALMPINILQDPLYTALSYAWGERTLTEKLHIDGDNGPLMITPNLYTALLEIRLQVDICRIWVDAICINQFDDQEKSAQLRSMGLIYRRASSVYIWLGKHEREAQLLQELDQFSRTSIRDASLATVSKARQAVDGLISLPWFGRRWVIQEAVSNSNTMVFCGATRMQWIRLLKVLAAIYPEPDVPLPIHNFLRHVWPGVQKQQQTTRPPRQSIILGLGTLWAQRNLGEIIKWENSPSALGFLDILRRFSEMQCADHRDRIYALIGLTEDAIAVLPSVDALPHNPTKIHVEVDYAKTIEDIYIQFATAYLNVSKEGRLSELFSELSSRSNGSHLGNRNSWAPDWRLPIARVRFFLDPFPSCSTSVNEYGALEIKVNNEAHGFTEIAVVEEILVDFPHVDQGRETTQEDCTRTTAWLRQIWKYMEEWNQKLNPEAPFDPQFLSDLLRYAQIGIILDVQTPGKPGAVHQIYPNYRHIYDGADLQLDTDDVYIHQCLASYMVGRAMYIASATNVARTSTTVSVGIGPSHALPGDKVFVHRAGREDRLQSLARQDSFLLRSTDIGDGDVRDDGFFVGDSRIWIGEEFLPEESRKIIRIR